MKKEIFLILHNIRSLHNVGSIFRTADGAGVSKIYLTGYTPAPIDIFGKTRKEIAKTALGAENTVPWEKHRNLSQLIKKLKNDRSPTSIIGVEQDEKAIDYREFTRSSSHSTGRSSDRAASFAFVLGNEVRGLSKQTLKKCDKIIEIPMHGKKESLNVAVTAGIVLFHII